MKKKLKKKKAVINSRLTTINVKVTPEDKAFFVAKAKTHAQGNVSALFRNAVKAYQLKPGVVPQLKAKR